MPVRPNTRVSITVAPSARTRRVTLIRLWQSQNALRDEIKNELRRHGRKPRDQTFAEIALDVEFLGITVTAVGQHRGLAGFEAGFGAQIFGGVGSRAAGLAVVV